MTVLKHELRLGWRSLLVWTASIGCLMAVCVFLFPEMKGEMAGVGQMFASMGGFTEAFGMDRINFGEFHGFYAVECGNILGLGGAFFAALTAVSSLCKEEKEHTADFLLTHPVARRRVVTEKLLAVLAELLILNGVLLLLTVLSVLAIGETVEWDKILLLHLAYGLLQVEIAAVCFGISAFLRRGGLGIGLGLAALLYCLNIIANLTERAAWLKYVTPFGYADGAQLLTDGLDGAMLTAGMAYAVLGIAAAYIWYCRKDIS